jgi:hypothetical protein
MTPTLARFDFSVDYGLYDRSTSKEAMAPGTAAFTVALSIQRLEDKGAEGEAAAVSL